MNVPESIKTSQLLSWVDVARRLYFSSPIGGDNPPPQGVVSTDAYWSSLTIKILREQDETEVVQWLSDVFHSWLENEEGKYFIKLASPGVYSKLPVIFQTVSQSAAVPKAYRPIAALEGLRNYHIKFPEREENLGAKIVAFHSVKGGVGRTTAALSFAYEKSLNDKTHPVLLIDGDFEAPGISYLANSRKKEATISFEDVLALTHADPSEEFGDSIDFIVDRMADQRIDNVYVLPAKRLLNDLSGFAIRPENLISARDDNTYVLVDIVRKIANKLGCRLAVIDLRAGLVDIAIQFLTEPSVERVFVTTASGQSVSALNSMMASLGIIESQTRTKCRQPFILVNQVPIPLLINNKFTGEISEKLIRKADESFLSDAIEIENPEPSVTIGFMHHINDLVAMTDDWDLFVKILSSSQFSAGLSGQMADWWGGDFSPELSKGNEHNTSYNINEHKLSCQRLYDFSQLYEVAETIPESSKPLVIPPLQRLASDFINQPPIVIIEGAKGTGKTLTFRFLLEKKKWKKVTIDLVPHENVSTMYEGMFLPLVGSVTNGTFLLDMSNDARREVCGYLGGSKPLLFSETESKIKDNLKNKNEKWSDFWLKLIAGTAGFYGDEAWGEFVNAVVKSKDKVIILVEGLEEILTNPYSDPNEAEALLSLLREVPLRLREEAGRPVGFILLVRADMVEAAITQNLAQFRASYSNYSLTWRDVDIKELVVWMATKSGAIADLWSPDWRKKNHEEQDVDLKEIWGSKLGGDQSREARSTEWVISVLTDLTGNLTARDLVRFIGAAAQEASGKPMPGRLLSPASLKNAVKFTSEKKVEEYPKEVRQLQPIFEKFIKSIGFSTPFSRNDALKIDIGDSDLEILEKYGVAYQDDGIFEVPELFRVGLQMKREGARPNIISLTKRARDRAKG
ncbi:MULTISPECIES: ParA family protein [Serratia]|uniref:ParA family protein n=1 Tax=Serratia TaxID=613 RepID=UPI001560EA43|nr:ParA family protein [Serratia marcescens]NRN20938.1 ParA family protein [Serratia marcescens]NRN25684.1 ParA family protein [Serratia marcescens]NRN57136.1 ParA family protein [Serratia marcescens]WJD88101.1 ParA family protein [Serratia marcescens]